MKVFFLVMMFWASDADVRLPPTSRAWSHKKSRIELQVEIGCLLMSPVHLYDIWGNYLLTCHDKFESFELDPAIGSAGQLVALALKNWLQNWNVGHLTKLSYTLMLKMWVVVFEIWVSLWRRTCGSRCSSNDILGCSSSSCPQPRWAELADRCRKPETRRNCSRKVGVFEIGNLTKGSWHVDGICEMCCP